MSIHAREGAKWGSARHVVLVAAVLTHVSHAQGASAQPAEAAVALTYDAPAACPSSEQFVAAVVARAGQSGRIDPESFRAINVSIVATTAGFAGRLHIALGDGQQLERVLEDGHCGALVEALALLAAMEIAPIDANAPSRAKSDPTPATADRQNQAQPKQLDADVHKHGDYDIAVAAVVGLQRAPTPGTLLSGGVHLAFKRSNRAQNVGLSLYYGQTGLLRFDGGDVRFRWFAARIFGCPLGLKRKMISVAACATTEIGQLRGEPARAHKNTDRNGWWIAPGLGALLSMERTGFMVELFGGVIRPLQRDTFYFAPASSAEHLEIVNEPPKIGLNTELRLGATF